MVTQRYSTSFSLAIRTLSKGMHEPIYSIYGFVRLADEIVDTFFDHDRAALLQQFRSDTYQAIAQGISLNPVLNSFQEVVNEYEIEHEFIDAFLDSMEMDLHDQKYDHHFYEKYIYGSAEVVGLMCLKVFLAGNQSEFDQLKSGACRLGAAFQKVNFLRDMKSDFEERGRVYFPGVSYTDFCSDQKKKIEAEIEADFDAAYLAIQKLPRSSRFGVYSAYRCYRSLFDKIKVAKADEITKKRFRISNPHKMLLLFKSAIRHQLNIL